MPRLSEDVRRAQLVESALIVAERGGVDSVTSRAVAKEAGVSLGLLHFRFESMDELSPPRWFVDRDGDAMTAALDDLAEFITAKAIEVPDSDSPDPTPS
jgi:DNA-binding transcriptional regulator YbjK